MCSVCVSVSENNTIYYQVVTEIGGFTEWCIKVLSTLFVSTVRFDDCMGNEAVVFQSTDPIFSVRTDGSIFAKGEGASLDEPVQFKLTANGPHTQVWETVVQLALIDPPPLQRHENEVSYTLRCTVKHHALNFNRLPIPWVWFGLVVVTVRNQVKTPRGLERLALKEVAVPHG